jgi:hypothetical protein
VNCDGASRKGRWRNGNLELWLDPPPPVTSETAEQCQAAVVSAATDVKDTL